jgi:hypothetical protein
VIAAAAAAHRSPLTAAQVQQRAALAAAQAEREKLLRWRRQNSIEAANR